MRKLIKKRKKLNTPTPKMHVEQTPKKFLKPKEQQMRIFKINSLILISTIFIMVGLFCISYNYIQIKKELAYDTMNQKIRLDQIKKDKKKDPVKETPTPKKTNQEINYEYVGYLEIPKIKLNKGFLAKESPYNNVDKNLLVLKESNYPDVKNGNLIIAGHSGTGYKAFFKYLYKLQIGDIAKVTYNGKIYTYKITNIEQQPKTGTVTINRTTNKRCMTLITCTYENDQAQTIYLLENIKIEKEGE